MAIQTASDDEAFEADIEIDEYKESDPFDLSKAAARMLTQDVNGGSERDGDRIKLRYNRDGQAILTAKQYVGVVSLRDGPTIQINPKAAGTNLLYLLRYAHNTTATTFDTQTPYTKGAKFFDALGVLYEAELRRILNKGLHSDYVRQSSSEKHLRGQLNLQRQLQSQPPHPTSFECTYNELTYDIIPNRAILYATSILLGLVSDRSVTQSLRQHQQLLRRRVDLKPVTSTELDGIQLTRLSEHYEDILRLTRMIIGELFVGELQAGKSASFAMLVNMNSVFQNAIAHAFDSVISEYDDWDVEFEETDTSLVSGGKHTVTIKPDIKVSDATGTVRLVGDAKWKTDTPKNDDYYQMTSYMLAHDAPGLLLYPNCRGKNATQSRVANQFTLSLLEVPTAVEATSYEAFVRQFEQSIRKELESTFN